jgi:hypothetical protein
MNDNHEKWQKEIRDKIIGAWPGTFVPVAPSVFVADPKDNWVSYYAEKYCRALCKVFTNKILDPNDDDMVMAKDLLDELLKASRNTAFKDAAIAISRIAQIQIGKDGVHHYSTITAEMIDAIVAARDKE